MQQSNSTNNMQYYFCEQRAVNQWQKATNGDCHTMLKVIQHGMMIAEFQLDHSRKLQIIHKIAAIEESDYWVVNNRASLCSPPVCFFLSFEGFKKLGLPPKLNGANLGARPPNLVHDMVSFWRWQCANSTFWPYKKHASCTQTKRSLSCRILSSYFPFWYNYNTIFSFSSHSLLLRSESAHLFLFYCAVSLAWGRKAYCTIIRFPVTQDYLGWPLCLGETLPLRTSNKKLNGQSAVSTRLPTLQHPLEKQVTSLQELCLMHDFLQTHLQEPGFFWFTSNAFVKRPILLKYWLLCPFSMRKPHAKAVPSKDYFTHLRSLAKSTSSVSAWILCSDVTSWSRASKNPLRRIL
jgi:hypothetical protein